MQPIPLQGQQLAANKTYLSSPAVQTAQNKKRKVANVQNQGNQVLNEERYIIVGFPDARNTFFYKTFEELNTALHGTYGYVTCVNNQLSEEYKKQLGDHCKEWKLPKKDWPAKVLNSYKVVRFSAFHCSDEDNKFLMENWCDKLKLIGESMGVPGKHFGKITIDDKQLNTQMIV